MNIHENARGISQTLLLPVFVGQSHHSRAFATKEWSGRNCYAFKMTSVQHTPLVNPDKILTLSLHIKLGLTKSFVKQWPKKFQMVLDSSVKISPT